jgi:hypothetical protein
MIKWISFERIKTLCIQLRQLPLSPRLLPLQILLPHHHKSLFKKIWFISFNQSYDENTVFWQGEEEEVETQGRRGEVEEGVGGERDILKDTGVGGRGRFSKNKDYFCEQRRRKREGETKSYGRVNMGGGGRERERGGEGRERDIFISVIFVKKDININLYPHYVQGDSEIPEVLRTKVQLHIQSKRIHKCDFLLFFLGSSD